MPFHHGGTWKHGHLHRRLRPVLDLDLRPEHEAKSSASSCCRVALRGGSSNKAAAQPVPASFISLPCFHCPDTGLSALRSDLQDQETPVSGNERLSGPLVARRGLDFSTAGLNRHQMRLKGTKGSSIPRLFFRSCLAGRQTRWTFSIPLHSVSVHGTKYTERCIFCTCLAPLPGATKSPSKTGV